MQRKRPYIVITSKNLNNEKRGSYDKRRTKLLIAASIFISIYRGEALTSSMFLLLPPPCPPASKRTFILIIIILHASFYFISFYSC